MTDPQIPRVERYEQVLVVGTNGSGKTEWIYSRFRPVQRQKIILDVKREIVYPGADRIVGKPQKIDWREPIIQYVPVDSDRGPGGELDKFFGRIWDRCQPHGPGVALWIDECYGVTTQGSCPPMLHKILTQGRTRNIQILAATQRPVGVWPWLRSECSHVVVMAQVWGPGDAKTLSETMVLRGGPDQLNDELTALACQYQTSDDPMKDIGRFAHLHWHRKTRRRYACPPIPDYLRP